MKMSPAIRDTGLKFNFGPYVPIIRTEDKIIIDKHGVVDHYYELNRSSTDKCVLGEIFPDDSVVDAPSLVTPLLLKKKTIWPVRKLIPTSEDQVLIPDGGIVEQQESQSDEVQFIKVVDSSAQASTDSENQAPKSRPIDEYIKASVIANLTKRTRPTNNDPVLAINDFHKSSASELLYSIGLNRVNEFILNEDVKRISNKIRKNIPGLIPDLEVAKSKLAETRKFNTPYLSRQSFSCHKCSFQTDSRQVLEKHLENPHKELSKLFSCNWCNFKTKDTSQILIHNHIAHRKTCRIEKQLPIHCCRYCTFESNSKRKFTSHITKCEQTFQEDLVQVTDDLKDYPALTSKLITQQDIKAYESTLKSLRLAAYNPHHIKVSSASHGFVGQPILLLPKNTTARAQTNVTEPVIPLTKAAAPYADLPSYIGKGSAGSDKSSNSLANQQEPSQLMRLLSSRTIPGSMPDNRATILRYPKPQSVYTNGMSVAKNVQGIMMAPPNQASTRRNCAATDDMVIDLTDDCEQSSPVETPNITFVICEICDAYIENLTLFKSHMQWVHKVKIHHKLQESSRPPLNCQKCEWRFFTDQGLERHLLGSHGLVTTNMQDMADNDKDSGRCPVCGMRCAKKLVSHMKEIHKSNLKPAQLSYKCTACSATFGLYKLFENHVYRIHADALKGN